MLLMQNWYHDCLKNHPKCVQQATSSSSQGDEDNDDDDASSYQYPTRLIDAGLRDSEQWRLCDTCQDALDESIDAAGYATLSHRWGDSPFIQLNSSTMDIFRAGMPDSTLPATFKDAIHVVRQLGIRYLWIDSLCILQDSREDWSREAPLMHRVYGRAAFNIVAAHSTCPRGGLFRRRRCSDPRLVESITIRSNWRGEPPATLVLWDDTALRNDFLDSPLSKRGWVLQERLLAPRVIQFGAEQVFWRCSESFAWESMPRGAFSNKGDPVKYGTNRGDLLQEVVMSSLPKYDMEHAPVATSSQGCAAAASSNAGERMVDLWEGIVQEYSACALTYSRDKLPALSGIAKLFLSNSSRPPPLNGNEERYLAGLWWSCIPRLLCWRVRPQQHKVMDGNVEEGSQPNLDRTLYEYEYRAPSWSWASVDEQIEFTYPRWGGPYELLECLIDVMHAEVVPLNHGDETGELKGGHVIVRGVLHSLQPGSQVIIGSTTYRKFKVDGGEEILADKDAFTLDWVPSSSSSSSLLRGTGTAAQVDVDLESDSDSGLWVLPTYFDVSENYDDSHSSLQGLVLRRKMELLSTATGGGHDSVYERVGYFYDHSIGSVGYPASFGITADYCTGKG